MVKIWFSGRRTDSQQQIVVKSLDTNYQNVGGLSGATILGDGKVALILDIEGIVKTLCNKRSMPYENQYRSYFYRQLKHPRG